MENKELHNFTFVPTFLTDVISLPYEQRCQIIDAICYWGVYKELPPEIEGNALAIALLKNAQRMIEGQDKYRGDKVVIGKKGGRTAAISDEQILEAYVELYKKNGCKPTEKEVIEFCGGGVQRIGTRSVWKKRDQYLYECMEMNDTFHTNVLNETYKDTYNTNNHTEDTYKETKNEEKVCMEHTKTPVKALFDF
jgi:hypothetical protein